MTEAINRIASNIVREQYKQEIVDLPARLHIDSSSCILSNSLSKLL